MPLDRDTMLLACIWLFALGLCLWQVHKLLFGIASRNWKRTQCKILKAYIDEHRDRENDATSYSAHVVFTYRVQGRTFEGRRLTYRAARGLVHSNALCMLAGISQGCHVDVFYDPRRPSRAVLIRGVGINNFV